MFLALISGLAACGPSTDAAPTASDELPSAWPAAEDAGDSGAGADLSAIAGGIDAPSRSRCNSTGRRSSTPTRR